MFASTAAMPSALSVTGCLVHSSSTRPSFAEAYLGQCLHFALKMIAVWILNVLDRRNWVAVGSHVSHWPLSATVVVICHGQLSTPSAVSCNGASLATLV